jgi:hypothetical protein
MALNDLFMLPAVDGAVRAFLGKTLFPKRTVGTHRGVRSILERCLAILLSSAACRQVLIGRATIRIGRWIIGKLCTWEPSLFPQRRPRIWFWDIDNNPGVFAILQFLMRILACISRSLQVIDVEILLGLQGH